MTNGPEVTKLINSGWLTPLDPLRMSRFTRNASDLVRDPPWDPGNRYTVAWQSRLTGIAFRPEAEEVLGREPRSINDLFDTALEGRVGMMSDSLDLGSAGPGGRHRSRDLDRGGLAPRRRPVAGAARAGLVRGYYGQSCIGAPQEGEIWAAQAWSGDVFQAQQLGSRSSGSSSPTKGRCCGPTTS